MENEKARHSHPPKNKQLKQNKIKQMENNKSYKNKTNKQT